MHLIGPEAVTPALRALFDPTGPASHRCEAVLAGLTAGTILVDDAAHPTVGAVREATDDGTTFLGGAFDASTATRVIDTLRADGEVLIGYWPDDPRLALLPPGAGYDGWVLEWVGPPGDPGAAPPSPPPGCRVARVDRPLLDRCAGRDGIVRHFGGADRFFEHGLGFCLLVGDEIACEVFLCPAVRGLSEPWVETYPPYRRRGLATVTCAHALHACARLGQRPYWNTAKQNVASAALAAKLGFGQPREYRLLAWSRYAP
jgi:GNAT superfamily N-acetyltransferase